MWLLKTLSGDLGGQSPKFDFAPRSDLVRTWLGPRSHLVEIAASQNPARRGFGKALQWFATWSAAAATAAAAVVACAAASEQGVVFLGRETKSIRR